jgi:hypothetical protein
MNKYKCIDKILNLLVILVISSGVMRCVRRVKLFEFCKNIRVIILNLHSLIISILSIWIIHFKFTIFNIQ